MLDHLILTLTVAAQFWPYWLGIAAFGTVTFAVERRAEKKGLVLQ